MAATGAETIAGDDSYSLRVNCDFRHPGRVTLFKGTKEDAKRFVGYFDNLPACQSPLAVPRT